MQTFRASLLVLFVTGYLVNFFVKIPFLPEARAFTALVFFSCSIFLLKPINKKMCILLVGAGVVLLLSNDAGIKDWVRAITENSGLISLLLTVPLLGLILGYASYEEAISALAVRYIRSEFGYYAAVVTIVNLLGTFLNMAAAPLCYHMIKHIAQNYDASLTAKALGRGFSANLLWSPNLIAVAVSLQYVNLSWYELAPVGILFSLIAFLLTLGLGKAVLSRKKPDIFQAAGKSTEAFPASYSKVLTVLGVQIVLVLSAVLVLDYSIGKNVLVAVSLVSFFAPLLIALITGKIAVFNKGMEKYFSITLPSMANEFMLFSCVGFFGYSLGTTDFGKALMSKLLGIFALYPDIAPFLIIWTIGLLAMIGVHPIITISSLGICLANGKIGLTELQVAMSLMTGYMMYLLTSPFSSMTMILSGLLDKNVFDVSVRINLGYAMLVSLTITILLHFFR